MIPEHGEHGSPLVNIVARYEDGSDIDVTNEIERLREAGRAMLDHIVRSDPPDMGDINSWGALLDGRNPSVNAQSEEISQMDENLSAKWLRNHAQNFLESGGCHAEFNYLSDIADELERLRDLLKRIDDVTIWESGSTAMDRRIQEEIEAILMPSVDTRKVNDLSDDERIRGAKEALKSAKCNHPRAELLKPGKMKCPDCNTVIYATFADYCEN